MPPTDTDKLQKTWIPEGTEEYRIFKHTTDENHFLSNFLKERLKLSDGELLLDVGGREGDIAITLQKPEYIHIVDHDPNLKIPFPAGKFIRARIQDTDLSAHKYKLIICSHVLGYLGAQSVQDEVFKTLVSLLDVGGTLVLFYNTNTGYMDDLLAFSKNNLDYGHYDYFDEALLDTLDKTRYKILHDDVSFKLNYPSYEGLAHCCWFLYGAMDQDIPAVSARFLPKLKADLARPTFDIDERVTLVTRIV